MLRMEYCIAVIAQFLPPLPPLGHVWDVMLVWRKGNINKNCLCVTVVCTIIMVHKDIWAVLTGRSTVSGFDLAWFSSLVFQAPLCLQSSWCCIYIKFFCLHPSLYLLVSFAWWDWPLTWLTNHCASVLWHCWLGHVTRRIVSEMTYNVSSGMRLLRSVCLWAG